MADHRPYRRVENPAFVELKLALADYLRGIRVLHGWTQKNVANSIDSSQSRVAKMLLLAGGSVCVTTIAMTAIPSVRVTAGPTRPVPCAAASLGARRPRLTGGG